MKFGELDSAELKIAEALEAIDDDREKFWKESVAGYEVLKDIYLARGDEVNVAAITNFISAIYKDYATTIPEQGVNKRSDHQEKIYQIREQAKAELEACVVSPKAPYPNSERREDEVEKSSKKFKQEFSENTPVQNVYKKTSEKLRNFAKDLIKEVKAGTADKPALEEPPYDTKYAIVFWIIGS